jgi:hypothetical protein
MRAYRGADASLEHAFRVLRVRGRGVVSFRQFVILRSWPSWQEPNSLHASEAATQPLRVLHL